MYRVILTDSARKDIQDIYTWWAKHRSGLQANQWYLAVYAAIATLTDMPSRCSLAPETELLPQGIRQLFFGLGFRSTHRIVFTIEASDVIVLRVRHVAQNKLVVEVGAS